MTQVIRRMEINEGVKEYSGRAGAALIDVRSRQEYAEGHIHGSINIPFMDIPYADELLPDTDAPVYVYCVSGHRSAQAAAVLDQMGYTDIINIGGIEKYFGEIQK